MFKKVVIGVDGQQGGRDAIALAQRLSDPGAELTLAHTFHAEAHPWRGANLEYDAIEREQATKVLTAARDEADITAELRGVGAPAPGRGLHEVAEAVRADLLVVGSSRRGLFGRVLLGDDTRAALNGAPCAIAVAPAGYATQPGIMREIGVGYNGSAEAEHALRVARDVASAHGAKLSAFEAVSLPAYLFMGTAAPLDEPIDEMIEAAHERITALGGVEAHAAYGRPSEELAMYSASLDLLVVGSRDYGPVGRLLHGSTSQELARVARCPLLVLTRAARAAEAGQAPADIPAAAPVG